MITEVKGTLEIDHTRGVIYFHREENTKLQPTLLRICRLPTIPENVEHIDITHMTGCSYTSDWEIVDTMHFCPECERANQFGELCESCRRQISEEQTT